MSWERRMSRKAKDREARREALERELRPPQEQWDPVQVPAGAAVATEPGPNDDLQWSVADNSIAGHVIHGRGRHGKSGPKALCGRYPQRGGRGNWLALWVGESSVEPAMKHYNVEVCGDCKAELAEILGP